MTPKTATYEVGLDTPIHMLTPRQLFEMQGQWLKEHCKEDTPSASESSKKWYVNSIKELADILGTSESTLYKMKAKGLLDEAVSQYGRWMCIDVQVVIDKFKLSNRRMKTTKGVKRDRLTS